MCTGSEFQVDGAEKQNAREVKLLVMSEGLARRPYLPIAYLILGVKMGERTERC